METRHTSATKRKSRSEEQESHHPQKRSRTVPAPAAPAPPKSADTGSITRSAGLQQGKQAAAGRPATRQHARTASKAEPVKPEAEGGARTGGRRARDRPAESPKALPENPGHLKAKRQPPAQHNQQQESKAETEVAAGSHPKAASSPSQAAEEQQHAEPSGTGRALRRRVARGEVQQASAVEQAQQAATAAARPSLLRSRGASKASAASEAAAQKGEEPAEGARVAGAQDTADQGNRPATEQPGEGLQRGMAGRNAGRDTNEEVGLCCYCCDVCLICFPPAESAHCVSLRHYELVRGV